MNFVAFHFSLIFIKNTHFIFPFCRISFCGINVTVRFYNKILDIDSPVAEQIKVYTLSGELLHRASKRAGKASFTIPNSERVLIVRGSSGWTKKIEDR